MLLKYHSVLHHEHCVPQCLHIRQRITLDCNDVRMCSRCHHAQFAIAQMLKQGTWYVPTLAVYYTDWFPENTPDGQRDRARANEHEVSFKKALKAGVKIAFGTDMGGIPWSEPIANEFGYMVKFGMSPMDAVKAATSRAADLLDMQGQLGVVAPGAYADVIAVSGDPLSNIDALKQVQFVMKDGKVFKQAGKTE